MTAVRQADDILAERGSGAARHGRRAEGDRAAHVLSVESLISIAFLLFGSWMDSIPWMPWTLPPLPTFTPRISGPPATMWVVTPWPGPPVKAGG